MNQSSVGRKVKLWKAFCLALFFIIPMIGASILYHYRHLLPLATTNKGELLQPPLPTQWLTQETNMPNKWHIVYFPKQCCNQRCDSTLKQLNHLYKALGKERPRADVTLLLTSPQCKITSEGGLHAVHLNAKQVTQFEKQLADTQSLELAEEVERLYIVDPKGNLILFYQQKHPYMAIYKDLKRLLKVSKFG